MKKHLTVEEFLKVNKVSEANKKYFESIEEDARIAAESEKPLVAEIAAAGLNVVSVWDLVNFHRNYPNLHSLLASHLGRDYHPKIKMAIARALIDGNKSREDVSWALVNEFKKYLALGDLSSDGVKQSIALALSEVSDPCILGVLNDLQEKVKGTILYEYIAKALLVAKKRGKRHV